MSGQICGVSQAPHAQRQTESIHTQHTKAWTGCAHAVQHTWLAHTAALTNSSKQQGRTTATKNTSCTHTIAKHPIIEALTNRGAWHDHTEPYNVRLPARLDSTHAQGRAAPVIHGLHPAQLYLVIAYSRHSYAPYSRESNQYFQGRLSSATSFIHPLSTPHPAPPLPPPHHHHLHHHHCCACLPCAHRHHHRSHPHPPQSVRENV